MLRSARYFLKISDTVGQRNELLGDHTLFLFSDNNRLRFAHEEYVGNLLKFLNLQLSFEGHHVRRQFVYQIKQYLFRITRRILKQWRDDFWSATTRQLWKDIVCTMLAKVSRYGCLALESRNIFSTYKHQWRCYLTYRGYNAAHKQHRREAPGSYNFHCSTQAF